MTANVFEDDRRACEAAGMVDFVAKPVIPRMLFEKVFKWLSQPRPDQLKQRQPTDTAPATKNQETAAIEERSSTEPELGSAVDPQALAKIFGDDKMAQLGILKKFVIQTEESLALFESAFETRDAEQIGFNAHKLKSSARTVGANDLADLCFELELAGKNTDWPAVDRLAGSLRPAVKRVGDYVASLLKKANSLA
jgi:HPt (histidine-containing phosphotransfer) domain-containing protein